MMDPLSALGLAANVISVVDFSVKTVAACHALYKSTDGTLPSHNDLTLAYENLPSLLDELRVSLADADTANNSLEDKALLAIGDRCIETVNELQSLLRELKLQKPGDKWKALKKTIKSSRFKGKLDEVETTLNRYRHELDTELLLDLRRRLIFSQLQDSKTITELNVRHNQILAALVDNQSVFTQATSSLQDLITQLNQSVHDEHLASRNQYRCEYEKTRDHVTSAIADLKVADEDANARTRDHVKNEIGHIVCERAERINHERILKHLYYPGINDRREQIADIHVETCQWIFEECVFQSKGKIERQNPSSSKWTAFLPWLSEGSGIYWIQGKPGAGKSTLMNYICDDERTLETLQTWTHPRKIVILTFFFWSAGTALQKSIVGMLRSILYQLIKAEPEMSRLLSSDGDTMSTSWTERKLKTTLLRLLNDARLSERKICFFIDGLDEHAGDWMQLTTLFQQLTQSQSIKACVSSRPYNIFRATYNQAPQLRMEDFTRHDIQKFASEVLSLAADLVPRSLGQIQIETLSRNINNEAKGVFLWVDLAVKSLTKGIINLDSYPCLQNRLSQIPPELSGLYKHILESIEPEYELWTKKYLFYAMMLVEGSHEQSYPDKITKSLKIALKAEQGVSCFHLTFLESGPSLEDSMDDASPKNVLKHCDVVRARLNASCFGFLDLPYRNSVFEHPRFELSINDEERELQIAAKSKLSFSHETARKFVQGLFSRNTCSMTKAMSLNLLVQLYTAVVKGKIWQIKNLRSLDLSKLYVRKNDFLTSVGEISSALQVLTRMPPSDTFMSKDNRAQIQILKDSVIKLEEILSDDDTWYSLTSAWEHSGIGQYSSIDPEPDFLSFLARNHPSPYIMERLPKYVLSPTIKCKNKATYFMLLTLDPDNVHAPFGENISLAFDLLKEGADPAFQITNPEHYGLAHLGDGHSDGTAWDFFLHILLDELYDESHDELYDEFKESSRCQYDFDVTLGRITDLLLLNGCDMNHRVREYYSDTIWCSENSMAGAGIMLEVSALQIMRWQAKPWSLEVASQMEHQGATAVISIEAYEHYCYPTPSEQMSYVVGPPLVDELTQHLRDVQDRKVFQEIFLSNTRRVQRLVHHMELTGIPHPGLTFLVD